MTTSAIDRARIFSRRRLDALRTLVPDAVPPGVVVVACGSYSRREASPASDFDYFAIAPQAEEDAPWTATLREIIGGVVTVAPAEDGAFAKVETPESMVRNIGGQGDDNQKLTRRMLFLLEGSPLSADEAFRALRRSVLDRYMSRSPACEPLALFLLNDILRYYRTMAVDYEYKTTEGHPPKPWGLRSVKLLFSRKLLYASGLFAVAATRESAPAAKAERIDRLLDLLVIERLESICGTARVAPLLSSYDRFLATLEDGATRRQLDALTRDEAATPLYAELLAEGRCFADRLLQLFHETFGADHPIHRALVF